MAVETETNPNTPMSNASAFDEEAQEKVGRVKHLLQQAAKSARPDVLMSLSGVPEFEGADTEEDRLKVIQQMHLDEQQLVTRAAVQRTIAGMKAMTRQYDAFFEMPEFADLLDLQEAGADHERGIKAMLSRDDYGWENFGAKVREYSGSEIWSSENFIKALKNAEGTFTAGKEWQGGQPGFSFESETTERTGLKALLSSPSGSPGITPYPEQMSLIVEQALRRPTLFRLINSISVQSNSYQFREESDVAGNFRYFNEPPTTPRSAPRDDGSLNIEPQTKTLKTMLGTMEANFEQLWTEPIARQWIRTRLLDLAEIWIDGQLCSGAGGTGAITGLSTFTPDSATPTTQGNWVTGANTFNNFYQKATAETDMQALFEMIVHAEVVDHGMTVPTVLFTSPQGYQQLVNPTIQTGDARWLFPQVMAGGDARPVGLTVIKNTQVASTENYVIDPRHMVFRPHAQGLVFEYEREPRRLLEHLVAYLMFEYDIYRRQSVLRGDGFTA